MGQEFLREFFNFRVDYKKVPAFGAGLFQFEPTEFGAETLKSYGLHFKEQDQGFVIAAPGIEHPDTGLWELQNQFPGNQKLSFAVFTNDLAFFDRSGLPYDTPGEYIYYFNNCNAQSRSSKLLLDNCGVKVGERVKLHTKQFSGELVKDGLGISIVPKVRDCWGNGVAATQYDYSIDEVNHTYCLNLTRLVDGLYTIEYNQQSTVFYCAKASFIRRIPLAIVEVWVGEAVPKNYQVVQRIGGMQYINRKEFHLHFGNYYYYWRYKIIPVNVPLTAGLKIQTDQSDYSFTPEQTQIDQYRNPVWFVSQQLVDTPNDDLTINLYQVSSTGATPALIGPLPKAGEAATLYYIEEARPYAQVTLYLVYEKGEYLIKEKYDVPVPTPNLTVTYTQYEWESGNGATVNVAIKNNGTTAINGWTMKFSFSGNQKITNLWRGVYTQSGTNVTVTNVDYNGTIFAGGSETFGFNISYSGTNNIPSNIVVNGVAATGSSSTMTVNNFVVSYSQSDWYNGKGASVSVVIKNIGTGAVNGWKLAFSLFGEQKITELWCGNYTQSGANVVVTNADYNGAIAAGGAVRFSFNISYSTTRTVPNSFTVYG